MSVKDSGSVYRVKNRQLSQIRIYSDLTCLTKIEKKFLISLLELCTSYGNTYDQDPNDNYSIDVSRDQLRNWLSEKKIGSGITILKKRSNDLEKLGIFKKEQYQRPKCKPANLYVLQDPSEVMDIPDVAPGYADHRPNRAKLINIKNQLIESGAQILDGSAQIKLARSERLWNGVFGSCMRSSKTDPRRNDPFTTIYSIGNDKLKIITSCQSDSEICHIDDQRTIRAIITMLCIQISEKTDLGVDIKNEFYIDVVDLCKLMGLDGSGANRDTIRDSMKRLYSTNFNLIIDADKDTVYEFSEQFGITAGADNLNFRFLTELDSSIDREHGGASVRRPRWYRIALHSKTFEDLANPTVISTFIDNKEILKVSSGLIHIFYTWCSIQVKRSGDRVIKITLPSLQKFMIPASRYDNFKERFLLALKQHQKKNGYAWNECELNTVHLFGYIIKISPDPIDDYKLSASRDKNDPVIGDKSMHNRLRLSGTQQ